MARALPLRPRASIRLLAWRRRWASGFARSAAFRMFCGLLTAFAIVYAPACSGVYGFPTPLVMVACVFATAWLALSGPLFRWAAREASTATSLNEAAHSRRDAYAVAKLRRALASLWEARRRGWGLAAR